MIEGLSHITFIAKDLDKMERLLISVLDAKKIYDRGEAALTIFRSKRVDRMKLIVWDGTGLVMTYKRIEGAGFVWPRMLTQIENILSYQH